MPELSLFSLIIVVKNRVTTLERTLQSIVRQTYSHWQCIVIDGGSTDGTGELIDRYQRHLYYTHSRPDRGIYDAMNQGVCRASGDWILFLGAGDELAGATVLADLSAVLIRRADWPLVVYGKTELVNERSETLQLVGQPWEQIRRLFWHGMAIPHQALLHHRIIFEQYGLFDESFKICGDYELVARYLNTHLPAFVDLRISRMLLGGVSSSPAFSLRMLEECRRVQRLHHLPASWLVNSYRLAKAQTRNVLTRLISPQLAARFMDTYRRMLGQKSYWTRLDN